MICCFVDHCDNHRNFKVKCNNPKDISEEAKPSSLEIHNVAFSNVFPSRKQPKVVKMCVLVVFFFCFFLKLIIFYLQV